MNTLHAKICADQCDGTAQYQSETCKKGPKPNVDCYELHNLIYPEGIECSAFTEMKSGELCGIFFIHGHVTDGQVLLLQAGKLISRYLEERQGLHFCSLILIPSITF
ncbi:MAG: hypothetical protein V8Q57_01725 [Blautia sp.]